jgi:hypothetical protein
VTAGEGEPDDGAGEDEVDEREDQDPAVHPARPLGTAASARARQQPFRPAILGHYLRREVNRPNWEQDNRTTRPASGY